MPSSRRKRSRSARAVGIARPGLGEDRDFVAWYVFESFGYMGMASVGVGGIEEAEAVGGIRRAAIGEAGIATLAARMGFGKGGDAAADFQTALGRHRLRVAELFHELLAGGAASAAPVASAAAVAAWQAAADPKRPAYRSKRSASRRRRKARAI